MCHIRCLFGDSALAVILVIEYFTATNNKIERYREFLWCHLTRISLSTQPFCTYLNGWDFPKSSAKYEISKRIRILITMLSLWFEWCFNCYLKYVMLNYGSYYCINIVTFGLLLRTSFVKCSFILDYTVQQYSLQCLFGFSEKAKVACRNGRRSHCN